jgi:hypothetical protein
MQKFLFAVMLAAVVVGAQEAQAEPATKSKPVTQYKPRAQPADANRFYMEQNGKRMTAAEFDAWMKARGIRVATGKPKPAPKRKRGD